LCDHCNNELNKARENAVKAREKCDNTARDFAVDLVKAGHLRNTMERRPISESKLSEEYCVQETTFHRLCLGWARRIIPNPEFEYQVNRYLSQDPGTSNASGRNSGQGGVERGPIRLQYTYQGQLRTLTVEQTKGMLETCMDQQTAAFNTAIENYTTCVGAAQCN
jgi:hypothetical protein